MVLLVGLMNHCLSPNNNIIQLSTNFVYIFSNISFTEQKIATCLSNQF